jgi:hypothetical protein
MWDWLLQFTEPLDRAGLPYTIVGSVASSIYGEPRATNDLDLVIQMTKSEAAKLAKAYPPESFYVPPQEVIEIEFGRANGGHVNIIALDYMMKADIYPLSAAEAQWFERRRAVEVAGRSLWFAVPEAVIVHKLRYFREGGGEKHLRDVGGMLSVSGDSIDREEITRVCSELSLDTQWRAAQEIRG